VAQTNLSFRLGADLAAAWELERLPEQIHAARSHEEWLALAASRPDLEAARRMLAAGELEATVRRAALLPRVGLVLRQDLFDDTPFGTHGDSTTVMGVATLEIWNGGRQRAAMAAARAEAEAGRRDVERMERGIRLEVEQAWEELQTALVRRNTAERSLEAAREAERILEERFRSGVAKTLDLLDAVTARREAETRELVARAQAQLAAFRLAFKAGQPPETALAAVPPQEDAS
jgi:outer membrane protein TolC